MQKSDASQDALKMILKDFESALSSYPSHEQQISIEFQVIFEKALDHNRLPESIKDEFDLLNQLEGRYLLTNVIKEVTSLEGKGPCRHAKSDIEMTKKQIVLNKPIAVFTKEKEGSEYYRQGIRWTQRNYVGNKQTDIIHMVLAFQF